MRAENDPLAILESGLKLLGAMDTHLPLFDQLIRPVQSILQRLRPKITRGASDDSSQRGLLVTACNLELMSEYPAARALPSAFRLRLIEQALDEQNEPAWSTFGLAATDELESSGLAFAAPAQSVQGLLFELKAHDAIVATAVVENVLKAGWTLRPLSKDSPTFVASHPGRILAVSEAWDLAHQLEAHPDVVAAEPDIEWVPAPPEIGGLNDRAGEAMFGLFSDSHLSCSGANDWSANELNIDAAWNASLPARKQGAGVKIGHLDTGLTHHVLLGLNDPRILLSQGANLYDPEQTSNQPVDPMNAGWDDFLRTWFIAQNGHGTGTLSVLLSSGGSIKGTAPRASVIPWRIGPTVVHWNVSRITKGIQRAHAAGCDVISLSMGGPPSRTGEMERAAFAAAEDGIIFCSAAANIIGSNNWTPIVVWPAALDPVIAVAGCNCERKVWSGSSRGPEVNISAPAQDVWRAIGKPGATSAAVTPGTAIGQGDGTSYATPATAGVAACWLAHHGGRAALAAHYGHARYVPMAFAHLLRTVAFNTPPNWRTDLLGPGILDAGKLLAAPLPDLSALSWPKKEHSLTSDVLSGIFRIWHWLTGGSPTASFNSLTINEAQEQDFVKRFGGELTYLLFDRPALLQDLVAAGVVGDSKTLNARMAVMETIDDGRLNAAARALNALKRTASQSLASALP